MQGVNQQLQNATTKLRDTDKKYEQLELKQKNNYRIISDTSPKLQESSIG